MAYLGQIMLFAGAMIPRDWAHCWGQLLPINQYTALYSRLGTTYGGDGRTSFALPDLRGRLAVDPSFARLDGALTPTAIGVPFGAESIVLSEAQMPKHTHALQASRDVQTSASTPLGNVLASMRTGKFAYFDPAAGDTLNPETMNASAVSRVGESAPHDNRMPSLGLTYLICISGAFAPPNTRF